MGSLLRGPVRVTSGRTQSEHNESPLHPLKADLEREILYRLLRAKKRHRNGQWDTRSYCGPEKCYAMLRRLSEDTAVTADDIEANRLRGILVEQREPLTDDLRKADPARWARAQIALGNAYVAIDPPRLKLPGLDESYEFRTATRRPDLPIAAYNNALSEARHLTANEFVRALVCRGSLNSGRPHAVYDCQHAVIGRIPEAGRDRSEILPFIGKRLFEAPAGIDDRNYCDARAGLAEALIAFAITGVNRAWGNEPVLFSDGVRPYLDEAVAAARAAVSRQAPASQSLEQSADIVAC